MGNNITVRTTPKNRISISTQLGDRNRISINTGGVSTTGGGGAAYLRQLRDVDASDPDNNETLVYDEVSGKYVVKEIPIINGGEF